MKTNNITYRRVDDYNIPNLTLPPEEASICLSKWGMMHKDYLLKHKKVLFVTLLAEGNLYQHCAEVDKQARDMFDTLVGQMKQAESVTEHLKETNQIEWVQKMSDIDTRARDMVNTELIYN